MSNKARICTPVDSHREWLLYVQWANARAEVPLQRAVIEGFKALRDRLAEGAE